MRKGKCGVAALAALLAAGVPASAGDGEGRSGPAIGIGISTLGLTAEVSSKVLDTVVLRLNGNWADVGYDQTVSGTAYAGSARVWGAGLIADFHPFANGFRLSGGARYHDATFTGTVSGPDATINGHTYTAAQYGTLTATVTNGQKLAPYLGLGWDSSHFSSGGLSVGVEVGAIYVGTPKATLTSTVASPALQADLDAEVTRIRSDYGQYGQLWPVASLTLKYAF